MTIWQKCMTFFLSFILSLSTTIRPKISVLINFFFMNMTIQPKLGVALILKFIIKSCSYISYIYYIHRSAALIFHTLYPWLYEVFAWNAWNTWRKCSQNIAWRKVIGLKILQMKQDDMNKQESYKTYMILISSYGNQNNVSFISARGWLPFCQVFGLSLSAFLSLNHINPLHAIPQIGQTHSNNLSPVSRIIVWMYSTILWYWCLKG